MWTALLSLALAAPCERPLPLDDFRTGLDASWAHARRGDPASARRQLIDLERSLPCLAAPLTTEDAAAFHRSRALEARYAADDTRARSAAAASQRLHPEGASVWAAEVPAFAALLPEAPAAVRGVATEEFGTSLAAVVYVDGQAVPARTVGEPVILQVFDPDGAPLDGAWVPARDPLPSWVAFPRVACAADVSIADLLGHSARAEAAYVALDVPTFEAALRAVATGLPCVTGRIGTRQAAAIHRLEGLRLYALGAEGSALRSLQQARALDPLYEPAEAVVRPGSALQAIWHRAGDAAPSPWLATRAPEAVDLVVDGIAASSRPAAAPSIVQLSMPSGEVLWTRYVPAGAALPSLDRVAADARLRAFQALSPAEQLYRQAAARRARRNSRASLIVGGAVAWSASAALFVRNADFVARYRDPTTVHNALPALQRQANLSATGSSALLLVGAGLIGAAVVLP